MRHGDAVLLQLRAAWSHHGGTWGILGGARDSGETAVEAALREAAEEAGVAAADVTTGGEFVDDHGGWSYTTVLARAQRRFPPGRLTPETEAVRWVPADEVEALPLHPGFAATWEAVRALSAAAPPGPA